MAEKTELKPPSKTLLALEARALAELGWFWQSLALLRLARHGDGHPVLVLPGFTASDLSTSPMRWYLRDRAYRAHGWSQGRNLGLRPGVEIGLVRRLRHIYWRHGRRVSLVGWSLGGLYARELAHQHPEMVRQVITLGSPFNVSNRANHAWKLYERVSGQTIEADRDLLQRLSRPLAVPATAIYSRSDGIVAWQCCLEDERHPQTQNVEVRGSHCGLGHNPMALYVIADRLAQPADEWAPFDRNGLRSFVYPASPANPEEALASG
jgi:pimeloyl-ACP methyl ester carboxylesterase